MTKEAYVSFKLAQKLKDKGFNETCKGEYSLSQSRYGEFRYFEGEGYKHSDFYDGYLGFVSAPTLQMAMAWLREEHLLHVYAEYKCFCDGMKLNSRSYYYWVPFIKQLPHCKYQTPQNNVCYELDDLCDTYEKACEKAIEYVVDNLL